MASYKVVKIALDATFDHKEISPPGQKSPDVGIQYLPNSAAGNVDLHLGAQGDAIPLWLMGQNLHSVPAENGGVYLSNHVAQAGAVIVLIIGYEILVDTPRQ